MRPQIRIQTTPIRSETKTKKAVQRLQSPRAQCRVSRTRNGRSLPMQAARVTISSRAAREANAAIAERGNAMKTMAIADIAAQSNIPRLETELVFLSAEGAEGVDIDVTEPVVDIEFVPGTVEAVWGISRPVGEYIPYQIGIEVLQYPEVHIAWIGESGAMPRSPGRPNSPDICAPAPAREGESE